MSSDVHKRILAESFQRHSRLDAKPVAFWAGMYILQCLFCVDREHGVLEATNVNSEQKQKTVKRAYRCVPAATMERMATRRPAKFTATSDIVTRPTPNITMLMLAMTGPEKALLYAKYSTMHTKGITHNLEI
jgi:hypothetical protein